MSDVKSLHRCNSRMKMKEEINTELEDIESCGIILKNFS